VNSGFLYGTNEIVIDLAFLLLMIAATEAGFHLGRKSEAGTPDNTKSQISAVENAILGILALLLGFTMFMVVARFEARKQLVLDEANAIGTAYLRTALLPAPEGSEIASLLRQDIDVRVQYGTASSDLAPLEGLNAQTTRLQNELWARAVEYGKNDPNPMRTGLLLQSLNQVIDLESAQRMAFQNSVPKSVIYVNGIVGLLAAMLVGYTFGLNGRRQIFPTFVLAVAITLVLALIIDLDRPRSGFIRVSQQPMIDLQHSP
jgi:prepilin signal peptidase PulO-like enzyme (type II secretory pathway)